MVYFTVAGEGSAFGAIKRAYIPSVDDGSNNMGASVTLDIDYITTPDGIAVDWVGRCVPDAPVSHPAPIGPFRPQASGQHRDLQIILRFACIGCTFCMLLPAAEICTGRTPSCRGWRLPCWTDATGSTWSRRTWDIPPPWRSTRGSGERSGTLVSLTHSDS